MKRKFYKMTNHSVERFVERYNYNFSKKKIEEALKYRKLIPVKRVTNTRTLYYGKIEEQPIKAIVNHNKIIVTVLPFIESYELDFVYFNVIDEDKFRIKIFPDCYLETKNSRLLTIFEKYNLDNNVYEKCKMKKKLFFDPIFNLVWDSYLNKKEIPYENEIEM